ncbi:MFS transporter [Phytohabitans kaempferiae]|uniref:MFS transporter n=1 Tax=Phytohabitans kaempferiae TaxID=1620943 RepID=A0ABV6M5F5_9ACTN
MPPGTDAAPAGRRYRLIYVVLAFGVVSQPLLQAMTVPALPEIQRRFGTDQATASWVLTAFLLAASVATPIGGRVGDAFGKTRVFGASALLAAAWLYAESKVRTPLVDLRLIARRGVWSANLVALMTGVAMYGSFAFLPQFNQTPSDNGYGFGASITTAGHMMLPSSVASFLCGLCAARLAEWMGVRLTILLGSVATAGALAMTTFVHEAMWEVILASCGSGVGTGLVFANLANAIVDAVPAEQTGTAIGMNANIRILGGAIGAAVSVTIVTADLLPSGYPTEQGYMLGFAFMACAALVAGLGALLLPSHR